MPQTTEEKSARFLSDILVLDLADQRAGFCSKLLADLGAKVVRIETSRGPLSGDGDPFCRVYNDAHKEDVRLDLDNRKGRRAFRDLVQRAGILVETFPRRYLAARHLSFGHLSRVNPGLIHLSISGFGRSGPRKDYSWNDPVISAYASQMYVSGDPGGPPLEPPGGQSSYATSLFGAIALLLALRERHHTGTGRFIDLSAHEALVSTLDHVMVDYFFDGTIARRQGNVYGEMGFVILPCSDGFIQIAIHQNWDTIVELMASENLVGDLLEARWQEKAYRLEHLGQVIEAVSKWTGKHRKEELFELGQAMRFPWSPVASCREVLASPQLAARAFFTRSPRGNTGLAGVRVPRPPYLFNGARPAPSTKAPRDGTDIMQLIEEPDDDKLAGEGAGPAGRPLRRPGQRRGILDGIRVLDFTWMLAGPFATRILADAGAEVIKVQSARTAKGGEDNGTGYFATWNRNKRSVTLNLDHPDAQELAFRLAVKSDVVMENFSPRIMENWGLAYDRLSGAKPDLIMASISAMGRTGPWRDYVGFGPTFHALSGLTHEMSRGLSTPVCLGHAYGDTIIGLYVALAVLAALRLKEATGVGQYIDLSGYEAVCSVLGPLLMRADAKGNAAGERPGVESTFRCRGTDRWCVIAPSHEDEWRALWSVVDLPGLPSTRFTTTEGCVAQRAQLEDIISRWAAGRSPEEAVSLLQAAGCPAGIVQDARGLGKDKGLANRSDFIALQHPLLGKTVSDRTPLFFGRPETSCWRSAPLLGQDNEYVFKKLLGLSDEEFGDYVDSGVIG